MMLVKQPCLIVVLMLALSGCNEMPPDTLAALEDADRFELYSLDPASNEILDPEDPPAEGVVEELHGFRVLGKVEIKDQATRGKLIDALREAASESDLGAAGCFWPRHGIRVYKGDQTYDLMICFYCTQVETHDSAGHRDGFLIGRSARGVFDEVLESHGLPIKKIEGEDRQR